MRALAALLLLGCSTQVDGNVPGYDRVLYLGEHDPRDVSLAIHVWRSSLSWWTGDLADVSQLVIEDTKDLPPGTVGLAPPGRILLYPSTLSSSALAHELTHEHLRRVEGDPDDDHAHGDGPWTALHDQANDDAADEMRRLGL